MATLDEITKEKERLGEALARVDAQREKLAHQLRELEAAERVLARYSKDTQSAKAASARTPTTARTPPLQREDAGGARLRPQNPLAASAAHRTSAIGFLRWDAA
jgi:hypothetical protein